MPHFTNTPNALEFTQQEVHDPESDYDSGISIESIESTCSLTPTITEFPEENGRTYHGYEAGKYVFPNDEKEQDRMDLEHLISLAQLGGILCLCPKYAGAKRVLDLGTGTGMWAMQYDEHPGAEVLGADLSPIQHTLVPPNCEFQIEDLEKVWTWRKRFDLIHCRSMDAAFKDWPELIRQSFNQLEPGGYFEFQASVWPPCSDDGTLLADSATVRYAELVMDATTILGRPMVVADLVPKYLKNAGFKNVVKQIIKQPVGPWPKDPRINTLGRWKQKAVDEGLEAFALAPLTRALGWTEKQVLALCAEVRKEAMDISVHAYYNV